MSEKKSTQKKTVVTFNPLKVRISQSDKIISLGSCFSTEIGNLLESEGYDITINPFGVLFNPASIANSILRLQEGRLFSQDDIVPRNTNPVYNPDKNIHEGFTSFYHHGSFRRDTPELFLSNANESLIKSCKDLQESKWVMITFGTAWIYRHIEKNIIVSNCHKHPATEFQREFLQIEQITETFGHIISNHQEKEWIFTVSPIRHIKDGLHENQLSKATLLIAIDRLCKKFRNVHYFPSYEIVLDEMRDYSHFAEDSVHPSKETVSIVFERFRQFAL